MKSSGDKSTYPSRTFHRRPQSNAKTDFVKLYRKILRRSVLFSIVMIALSVGIIVGWQKLPDNRFLEDQNVQLAGIGALVLLMVFLIWKIPKWQLISWKGKLEAKDIISLEISARATLIQMVGGLALLGGLYYTAKNLDSTQKTANDTIELARLGQITERFAKAVEQLGSVGRPEVQMGGIYALSRIAAVSDEDYWPIMKVLAAHVRKHSPRQEESEDIPDAIASKPVGPSSARANTTRRSNATATATETLGHTVEPQIQAILTVLGNRRLLNKDKKPFDDGGASNRLDLSNTNLCGADLAHAHLENAILDEADLREAVLEGADLSGASLKRATLNRANLERASLERADCTEARFEYAILKQAYLNNATFESALLNHATCTEANFDGANLDNSSLEGTSFRGVDLSQAKAEWFAPDWKEKALDGQLIDGNTKLPSGI